jgi:enamine deaminase RidA (YjgF/YER057c/UK114 family)
VSRKPTTYADEAATRGVYDSSDPQHTQAIVTDGRCYISGQVALNANGEVVGDDVETQTCQAFENVAGVLDEIDGEFADIIKLTSYLVDIEETFTA